MAGHSREELKGKAQTVRGLVEPSALGPTLMHEHLLWDIRTPAMQADPDQGPEIALCNCWQINYGTRKALSNYVFFDREIATDEVAKMRTAGGQTVVELTVGGLKPDPPRRHLGSDRHAYRHGLRPLRRRIPGPGQP